MKNLAVFMLGYLLSGLICICSQFSREKENKKEEVKTEYKIELINQTEIKLYSVSNDTTYTTTLNKLVEIIEKDNL